LFLILSIRFDLIALTVAVRDGSQFADVRHDDLIAELLPLLADPYVPASIATRARGVRKPG
jgi:hypothetical protein